MTENRLARGRLDCNCLSLGVVKLVGKNSRETFEGQISTVKIDLKKEKTSV